MPPTTASVAYKKKDGTLSVTADNKTLSWTPAQPLGSSAVKLQVVDITNLQQTPVTAPKAALKVFVGEENYVFSFTHKINARKEQEAITDTLRNTIAAYKAGTAAQLTAGSTTTAQASNGDDVGQSAAMAIAKALASSAQDDGWYDDSKLKSDFQLQRSLLESNKALNDRFTQALREKPESVSVPQFTAQFWSTRLHLLRAHAIEKSQKEGDYNVFPEIKYSYYFDDKGDRQKALQLPDSQIKLIFKQYPVVRQAYDETVPKVFSEPKIFFTRFFTSRLYKKVRGEPIRREDASDPVLDKYLDRDQTSGPASLDRVPHFIDLEGNEQNQKWKGNRPDVEMRESSFDRPILHVLNKLSEKLMAHVAPEDGEAHAPIGMDEETFDQLRLRDLAMNDADNRVVLNVREQRGYLSGGHEDDDLSVDAKKYAQQDPDEVISSMRSELRPDQLGADENGTLRLDRVLGFHSDEEDEEEDMDDDEAQANGTTSSHQASARINSHAALKSASQSILSSIATRWTNGSTDAHTLNGLSQSTFDDLTTTHNTTTEFLHYFWTLFLSGDSTRATELSQLVSTLDRSVDRINAVGEAAEKERQEKIERLRKQVREYQEKTGKRRRVDESAVGGGKAVVQSMVRPTVEALGQATNAYRKAFEEQTKEAATAGAG